MLCSTVAVADALRPGSSVGGKTALSFLHDPLCDLFLHDAQVKPQAMQVGFVSPLVRTSSRLILIQIRMQ